jgi:hypothetical protein
MLSLIVADLSASGYDSSYDTATCQLSVKLTTSNQLESLRSFCLKTLELIEPILGGSGAKSPRGDNNSNNAEKPGLKPSLQYMTLPDESYQIIPNKVTFCVASCSSRRSLFNLLCVEKRDL